VLAEMGSKQEDEVVIIGDRQSTKKPESDEIPANLLPDGTGPLYSLGLQLSGDGRNDFLPAYIGSSSLHAHRTPEKPMSVLKKMASTPTSDIARRIEELRTRRQEEVIQMAKDAGETPISDVLLSLITPEAYKEAGAMMGITSTNPSTSAPTSGIVGLPATNLNQPSTSGNLRTPEKPKQQLTSESPKNPVSGPIQPDVSIIYPSPQPNSSDTATKQAPFFGVLETQALKRALKKEAEMQRKEKPQMRMLSSVSTFFPNVADLHQETNINFLFRFDEDVLRWEPDLLTPSK
jgi:hypothetical protein